MTHIAYNFLNESTAVTQLFNKLTLEDEEPK